MCQHAFCAFKSRKQRTALHTRPPYKILPRIEHCFQATALCLLSPPPRPCPGPYLRFARANFLSVQAHFPAYTKAGPVAKELGRMWREMSADEKQPYVASHQADVAELGKVCDRRWVSSYDSTSVALEGLSLHNSGGTARSRLERKQPWARKQPLSEQTAFESSAVCLVQPQEDTARQRIVLWRAAPMVSFALMNTFDSSRCSSVAQCILWWSSSLTISTSGLCTVMLLERVQHKEMPYC